jgi:hypothetical protein
MSRRVASIALVLACGSSAAAGTTFTGLKGTVTLARIDVDSRCGASKKGTEALLVSCTEPGAFSGSPTGATASYRWTWLLVVNNGAVSGVGSETGRLTLALRAGTLVLATNGQTQPQGTPATLRTRGGWRVVSGTGRYARAKGAGTFVFVSIEKRRANPFTRTGSVALTGTLS